MQMEGNMKVLVTGSSGFIGGYIAEALKTQGYDVFCILGGGILECNNTNDIKNIKVDISDRTKLLEAFDEHFQNVDIIVHAAACLSKNDFDERLIQSNIVGMHNLMEAAVRIKCKKFIYISGSTVIGIPKTLPITENHVTAPNTMYHVTKLIGEEMLDILEKYNIQTVSLRLPSPIGRGMHKNTILSVFLNNAKNNENLTLYGKGNRKQNYVDVRDIVQAVVLCIEKELLSRCYNIAAEKSISNYELAQYCIDELNSKSTIEFNGLEDPFDGQDWTIDITKAKGELGYKPAYSIRESIRWIVSDESFAQP